MCSVMYAVSVVTKWYNQNKRLSRVWPKVSTPRLHQESINVEGGFFCGGWNFSKSVSMGSTFISEKRVDVRISKVVTFSL